MDGIRNDEIALSGTPQAMPRRNPGQPARPAMTSTAISRLQARIGRRLLRFIARTLFGFTFQFEGLQHVPAGEPVIVAAAPHRGWLDSFLIIMALPPSPRVYYYLGSAPAMFNRWWKRAILNLMGGVVPVSSLGQLNREGLETSLAILDGGTSPRAGATSAMIRSRWRVQAWVTFLSQRSGRRVLPVGLAGTQEL